MAAKPAPTKQAGAPKPVAGRYDYLSARLASDGYFRMQMSAARSSR